MAVCALCAQEQLPVDVKDPVYTILEIADIRGLVPPGSAVRPYSEYQVRSRLDAARAAGTLLSPVERDVLDDMARGFPAGDAPAAYLAAAGASGVRVDLSHPAALDFSSMGEATVAGTLWSALSYGLSVEGFLDMVNPQAFVPYGFSRQTDGFQVWTQGQSVEVSQGVNGHLNFGSAALSALSLDLLDHTLNFQLTRTRRDWGVGEGSLSLAGTARPVEAFSASVSASPGWGFSFLAGTLGNWWNPAAEQKMFSIHRVELFPTDWLYLSPWESVVYAKRLELSYLDPVMPFFFGQQLNGDYDNIMMGADAAATVAHFARLYVSLLVDEVSFPPLSTFFTRPDNRYAWQAGVKVPLPWPAWSLIVFQYTKIEPYTYTHYLQTVPSYTQPIEISYTNDGENLGYHLPPNSDEFLVRLSAIPVPGLAVSAQYQLIRHGTGDHLLGQIEGDINTPIIYSPPSTYPMKDFLHDGIYEWINIARLDASYSLRAINATLWAEYALVSATSYMNVTGNDVVKNLVGLGVRIASPAPASGPG
jgi:hypothetical protein